MPKCKICGDFGLVRVMYHSEEPFDLAICGCQAGKFYRDAGPDYVVWRLQIGPGHRVGWLEDFEEHPALAVGVDVTDAGVRRTARKPKL
jgi:hypothetical protein